MQKITTPKGEVLVVLSLAEYDELVDSRDLAIHHREMAAIARGERELLTSIEVKAFLDAVTPLAFWRKKRKFTQAALAEAVGITKRRLAVLERGVQTPEADEIDRLAKALSCRESLLFSDGNVGRRT